MKRNAAREVERNTLANPVRDSLELFQVTEAKFKTFKVFHVSENQIKEICDRHGIAERFDAAEPILGIRQFHQFDSVQNCTDKLCVKYLSLSPRSKLVKIR